MNGTNHPDSNYERLEIQQRLTRGFLPLSQQDTLGMPIISLYTGWSDVTEICGHNTISVLQGNTAYCDYTVCHIYTLYSMPCEVKWWRFVSLFA